MRRNDQEWAARRAECSLKYAQQAEAKSNMFQQQLVKQPEHPQLQRQVQVWQTERDYWLRSACNWEAIAECRPTPFS